MGQEIRGVSQGSPLTSGGDAAGLESSVGDYLARQRKLRGVSLDDLASVTRIPRRSLERLESGAFDGDTDGFSRGFVRTVADALGLDAEDAVLRLLGEPSDSDDDPLFRGDAFKRWAVVAALAIGGTAVVLGGWSLWTGIGPGAASPVRDEVFIRRDVVRELAASQSASFVARERLESRSEGDRD
jgi:transcriptional regulator with XRE-family HTH domain